MKKIGIMLAIVLAASCVFAQMPERGMERVRQARGEEGVSGGAGRAEMLLGMLMRNPELAEEAGVTEEQIQELEEGMHELQKEMIELRAAIEIAEMEQRRELQKDEIDEKAALQAVEELGELKTQLAKLRIRQLLLVKRTFTREQIEEIMSKLRKRMQRRASSETRPAMRLRRAEPADSEMPAGRGPQMQRSR